MSKMSARKIISDHYSALALSCTTALFEVTDSDNELYTVAVIYTQLFSIFEYHKLKTQADLK